MNDAQSKKKPGGLESFYILPPGVHSKLDGLKVCRPLGRFACAINEMHDDALQCAQRP